MGGRAPGRAPAHALCSLAAVSTRASSATAQRLRFTIQARDGGARAGVLELRHGTVETPAFVPLASAATVRTLDFDDVERLGYTLVLGNTFLLMLRPGAETVKRFGGLHGFTGWRGAFITDSGGFQVFSLGHGSVAEEIKGARRRPDAERLLLSIDEEGARFRSYVDGSVQVLTPERSMAVQAALGSDIALAFDECTPFHAGRDYTARSLERTNRWLDRCIAWQRANAPAWQALFGIVQGGVWEDLRERSKAHLLSRDIDGVAIGGSLGRDKAQMQDVVGWSVRGLPDELPRHLLGIGDVEDVLDAVALGIDTFDCATPTRLARHGTALVPDPASRFRLDVGKAPSRFDDRPLAAGCDCPTCRRHSRAYLHYLVRAGEPSAGRLLTLHNLAFMAALMRGIRAAVRARRFADYRSAVLAGREPFGPLTPPQHEETDERG